MKNTRKSKNAFHMHGINQKRISSLQNQKTHHTDDKNGSCIKTIPVRVHTRKHGNQNQKLNTNAK